MNSVKKEWYYQFLCRIKVLINSAEKETVLSTKNILKNFCRKRLSYKKSEEIKYIKTNLCSIYVSFVLLIYFYMK